MAYRAERNYEPVDRYTIAHGVVGAFLGMTPISFPAVVALAVGYEVFERTLKPVLMPTTKDTSANGAVDALAVVGGWGVAKFIKQGK